MSNQQDYAEILGAIEQGDFNQAALLLEQARTTEPQSPYLDFLAGEVALLSRDHASAAEFFRLASQGLPHEPAVWGGLCEASSALGDYKEAFIAGKKGLEIGGLTPHQVTCLAVAMAMLGERDAGIALLQAHTQEYPQAAEPWQGLGALALLAGEQAQAERYFMQAIECDRGSYESHTGLGQIALERKQFDQAQEHFSSALRIDPNFLPAQEGLIESLWQLRSNEDCVAVADLVLGTQPYNRTANFRRALALFGLGREQEGEQALYWQIDQDPNFVDAGVWLGGFLESVGREEEALLRYEQALEVCPAYRTETRALLEKRINQLSGARL